MCNHNKNGKNSIKNKKGDEEMVTTANEKMSINAFSEMRKILKREMNEQGLTAADVKKNCQIERMNIKPRIVIDTNVLIDDLLDEKRSSQEIMNLFYQIKITLLFSQETIGELVYVMESMARRNIRKISDRIKFLNNIMYIFYHSQSINTVNVNKQLNVKCNDPNDDMFLECAYYGKADFLITNDKASGMYLLDIGKTKIVSSDVL